MKKFLPVKGFTLVELLVVVSIIAILSVIGLAIFGNIQKGARDARRKTDVDSIAQAMEINYGKDIAGQYKGLLDNMFSSGTIPKDPVSTNVAPETTCPGVCKYCMKEGGSAPTGAACATSDAPVAAGAPSGGGTNTYWVVCTNLEAAPPNQLTFYCRGNQQ